MFWIKRRVKEFFALSHSQANGFIILVPLLGLIIFSGPLWHWYVTQQKDDFSKDIAKLDSIAQRWNTGAGSSEPDTIRIVEPTFFPFDPNRASTEELQSLGFSPGLALRIERYRQKGGKFRVKGDLLKIYGIDSAFYRQLYSFIDLPEKKEFEKKVWEKKEYEKKTSHKDISLSVFDLNKSDTIQLMKIDGIGTKRAQRIVKYREALGGFISTDQVSEVFGLDSVVIKRLVKTSFVAENFEPEKININSSDENTLASHPYLRKSIARSIVAYRFQHGEFKALGDIRNIHSLNEETIRKITPYLTLGD